MSHTANIWQACCTLSAAPLQFSEAKLKADQSKQIVLCKKGVKIAAYHIVYNTELVSSHKTVHKNPHAPTYITDQLVVKKANHTNVCTVSKISFNEVTNDK